MRLIFIYVMSPRWQYFSAFLRTEGYYYLIKEMVKAKIVDEVLIVIDSKVTSEFEFEPGINGLIVNGLKELNNYLRKDDIIWVRGGYRGWYHQLPHWSEAGHWMLLYAANTGRQKWPIWDLVFCDLRKEQSLDRRGRFWFYFKKPINPEIFHPVEGDKIYDLCIGASHTHDKKGQWKVVDGVTAYYKKYGVRLKCILPGARRKGVKTNLIEDIIAEDNLNIEIVGLVPRSKLAEIFNQTKLFVHLGGAGENDRGPLEAMCCGTPVMIETPKRHAPLVYECPQNYVAEDANDPEAVAEEWHCILQGLNDQGRHDVHSYYKKHADISIILPEMARLFQVFRDHPKADVELLREEYLK